MVYLPSHTHYAPIHSKHQHLPPPPPGNNPDIWTFEDWLVQVPTPLVKNCIQIPHPSTGFDCQMPLLKIKCFHWSTNVAKIFSKVVDSFLVEIVLGFEQIACKLHSTKWKFIILNAFYSNCQMFQMGCWCFELISVLCVSHTPAELKHRSHAYRTILHAWLTILDYLFIKHNMKNWIQFPPTIVRWMAVNVAFDS